jgi:hypothetical protein
MPGPSDLAALLRLIKPVSRTEFGNTIPVSEFPETTKFPGEK